MERFWPGPLTDRAAEGSRPAGAGDRGSADRRRSPAVPSGGSRAARGGRSAGRRPSAIRSAGSPRRGPRTLPPHWATASTSSSTAEPANLGSSRRSWRSIPSRSYCAPDRSASRRSKPNSAHWSARRPRRRLSRRTRRPLGPLRSAHPAAGRRSAQRALEDRASAGACASARRLRRVRGGTRSSRKAAICARQRRVSSRRCTRSTAWGLARSMRSRCPSADLEQRSWTGWRARGARAETFPPGSKRCGKWRIEERIMTPKLRLPSSFSAATSRRRRSLFKCRATSHRVTASLSTTHHEPVAVKRCLPQRRRALDGGPQARRNLAPPSLKVQSDSAATLSAARRRQSSARPTPRDASPNDFAYAAIKGMALATNDRYTQFFTPDEFKEFNEALDPESDRRHRRHDRARRRVGQVASPTCFRRRPPSGPASRSATSSRRHRYRDQRARRRRASARMSRGRIGNGGFGACNASGSRSRLSDHPRGRAAADGRLQGAAGKYRLRMGYRVRSSYARTSSIRPSRA